MCGATNSGSPSSTITTTSLIKPATPGTSSNKIQSASRQSPHEHGQQSIIRAAGITHHAIGPRPEPGAKDCPGKSQHGEPNHFPGDETGARLQAQCARQHGPVEDLKNAAPFLLAP